jgi:hypothetical protein
VLLTLAEPQGEAQKSKYSESGTIQPGTTQSNQSRMSPLYPRLAVGCKALHGYEQPVRVGIAYATGRYFRIRS